MRIQFLIPENFGKLNQIGQAFPVEFAFAKKDKNGITVLHPLILCRDYLGDAVLWEREPSKYKGPIYGYSKPSGINLNQTELVVSTKKIPDSQFPELWFLWELEDRLEIKRTTVEKIEDDIYYVNGDEFWMRTSIHISVYSLILRGLFSGFTSWEKIRKCVEYGTYISTEEFEDALFSLKKTNYRNPNPFKNKDWPSQHNCGGFITLVRCKQNFKKYGTNYGDGYGDLLTS